MCASFPVSTFCTCSPTLAQELHPTSNKPTSFTYHPPYCWRSHDKARCTLLPWEISEWKVIISTKISKGLRKKKKKLDEARTKSKQKWCIKFPAVHTADPHVFWIMNSSGQTPPTFLHFIRVPCISIVLHKLYVPWNNVLALSGKGLACLRGVNQMLWNSMEKFHHQLKMGFGSRTSNNFILCITLTE